MLSVWLSFCPARLLPPHRCRHLSGLLHHARRLLRSGPKLPQRLEQDREDDDANP
jgi:hypothetical protein